MARSGGPSPESAASGRRTRALRARVVRCESLARRLAAAAVLGLAACGGGAPEPVPIVLDEDACGYCRMAISEREYAAELVTREGGVERFDDVGCLAAWLRRHGRPKGAAAFVTDYRSGEWLSAESAAYVLSRALPTPMGSGLAAFSSRAAAEAAAGDLGGEVARWEEVQSGAAGNVERESGR